jgi:hypothetical protein
MTCTIVPFPTARRAGKIRHTAELLAARSGKGADHYWQQVIKGMRAQMIAAKLDERIIAQELAAFGECVESEIYRLKAQSA